MTTTMGPTFKVNPGLEQALRREIQKGVDQVAADWTRKLDQFHRRYANQPLASVKPALAGLFKREGVTYTDADLKMYAEQISGGGRIVIKAPKI